jgi:hypothetical protein
MSFSQDEAFPEENYSALRKCPTTSSEVIIPYKPVEEPAWYKHNQALPPKQQRFSKLTRWDSRCANLHSVAKLAGAAAVAAAVAAPVLMRIPH